MEKGRIDKQFEFLLEADKEKFIQRKTLKSDGETFENDAEHGMAYGDYVPFAGGICK